VIIVEKYFYEIPENRRTFKRLAVNGYQPEIKSKKLNTFQTHCILGNIAYNAMEKKKTALLLLNNFLGGPAMNSRLNLAIREKHGFAYNIESSYTAYTDTGIWQLYFACDKDYTDKTLSLIYKELRNLKEKKLTETQLRKARLQIIGQLAVSQAQHRNEMLSIGKSFLIFNKVDTLEEINKKFEKITSGQLMDVANEIFDEKQLCMLTYKSK